MNTKTKISRNRAFNIFLYIFFFLMCACFVLPLIVVISASFTSEQALTSGGFSLLPRDFTLDAYKSAFSSGTRVLRAYGVTIFQAVVGTVLSTLVAALAAYPLSRPDMAGKNLLTMLITFTMFFSGGMIPTYLTIKNMNLLNTFWVMVLPGAISVTNLLIMRNYFQHSVSTEIIEAAYVDGASNIGILMRVVIPISRSIFGVMLIYYFVAHWNSYFNALLYLNDRSRYPLQVFLRQILLQNSLGDMSGGSGGDSQAEMALLSETLKYSIIVVASVPALVIYPFIQKAFEKGVMIGSVKG